MLGALIGRLMGGGAGTSLDALRQASETGSAHIVDVREPQEFAAGHIPGSVNAPLSQLDPATLPTGKPVILVCQAGGRSASALRACRAIPGVDHYAGGVSGWRNAGGRLER